MFSLPINENQIADELLGAFFPEGRDEVVMMMVGAPAVRLFVPGLHYFRFFFVGVGITIDMLLFECTRWDGILTR